jgi:hypothetical protein
VPSLAMRLSFEFFLFFDQAADGFGLAIVKEER